MASIDDRRCRWRTTGRPLSDANILRLLGAGILLGALALLVLIARPQALPDFSTWPAGPERKARFVAFMQPLIAAENARVLRDRRRLVSIAAADEPGWRDRRWLRALGESYRLDPETLSGDELLAKLLLRVDAVPVSLALAQAAKESGWGTSRFARKGRNLFGQWCYEPGCGIVPRARGEQATHEVQVFSTPRESVASYLQNINTHPAYRDFRLARAGLRASEARLSGLVLAEELHSYSERGSAYVNEIKQLIRFNDLEEFDGDTDA